MTEEKMDQLWKFLAVSAMSIMFGMWVQTLRVPNDLVQERELNERILELQQKIDTQTGEIGALRQSVNQQAVDVAGIAAKVGVTAHPVASPTVRPYAQ